MLQIDAQTDKSTKVQNFEIRLSLAPVDGLIPVLPSTRRLLRKDKRLRFIKKLQERKLQAIFWLSFQLLNKIKNNKRKLKTFQSFHQLLSHWTQIQLKFSMIYSDLLIKKNFWDYWSRSHWKDKASKKAVRMMVVPTDAEDNETFEVRKKR